MNIQDSNSYYLILDSANIKTLCQIAVPVFKCLQFTSVTYFIMDPCLFTKGSLHSSGLDGSNL